MNVTKGFWYVLSLCIGASAFYYYTIFSADFNALAYELIKTAVINFCVIFSVYFALYATLTGFRQLATRNSQLATRNSQLATRNSQLATRR